MVRAFTLYPMRFKIFKVRPCLQVLSISALMIGCDQGGSKPAPVKPALEKASSIKDERPPTVKGPTQISVKSVQGDVFVGRKEGAGTLVTNVTLVEPDAIIETTSGAVAELEVLSQKLYVIAPNSVVSINQAETNTYGCLVTVRLQKGEALALGRKLLLPLKNGSDLVWTPNIGIETLVGFARSHDIATFSVSADGSVNCFDGSVLAYGFNLEHAEAKLVTVTPKPGERIQLKTMKIDQSDLRNVDEYFRQMTNR